MDFVHRIFLLAFLHQCSFIRNVWPKLELTMDNIKKVYKDDTVQFHCRYRTTKPKEVIVQWTVEGPRDIFYLFYINKDQKKVDKNTELSERIQVTVDHEGSVLTLRDVRLSDQCRYVCLVLHPGEQVAVGITHLRVFAPPQPPVIEGVLTGISVTNETLSKVASCEARGFPKPNITWYRNHLPLVPSQGHVNMVNLPTQDLEGFFTVQSELQYKVVKEDQDARFTCEVSYLVPGAVRTAKSRDINITVHSQNNTCDSGPCANGGTCVGSGDAYTCIYECQSSPCVAGSTCVDQINGYRCLCAPGRAGPRCDDGEGTGVHMHPDKPVLTWWKQSVRQHNGADNSVPLLGVGRSCHHSGLSFPHGSHWEEECNGCQCIHGKVLCSKVWCGRRPCLLPKMPSGSEAGPAPCPPGQECLEHQYLTCFSPPCHRGGVCSMPDPPPAPDTQCEPNSGYLGNSCVHITLIFKREQVPEGTTVEKICSELRYLPVTQTLARERTLRILCDRSYSNTDAVEVAMSFEQDGRVKDHAQIQQAASELISSLSKRPKSPLMLAVVETVTTMTPVDYLVPVLVCVFGVPWLVCIAVCIWWTCKRKKDRQEAKLAARNITIHNQL